MKTFSAVLSLLILSLPAAAQENRGPKGKPNDEPKVQKARWCEECKAFIEPKDLLEKHRCPRCQKVARKVETKIVTAYLCGKCGRTSLNSGDCCDSLMKSISARAAIVYKCESCGRIDTLEGDCGNAACKKAGKKLVMTCELPAMPAKSEPTREK